MVYDRGKCPRGYVAYGVSAQGVYDRGYVTRGKCPGVTGLLPFRILLRISLGFERQIHAIFYEK